MKMRRMILSKIRIGMLLILSKMRIEDENLMPRKGYENGMPDLK